MAIALTPTTAGLALISGWTASQPIDFTSVQVGTGRSTSIPGLTALVTPFSPARTLTINVEDRLADLVTFLVEDATSDAYTFNELGLFYNTTLVAYASAAAGQSLGSKVAEEIRRQLVSVQFVAGSTTNLTFTTTGIDPATETLNGSVRLAGDGQAQARVIRDLGATNRRALARVGDDLYISDTGTTFGKLNRISGGRTNLASLPSGYSNLQGLTWGGNNVDTATVVYGITQTPATDVLLRYTVATNAWAVIGTGAEFGALVNAMANYNGKVWAFDDQSPCVAREYNLTTGSTVRGSFFRMPANVTGTCQSAEFVGDTLYVWTTDGQWVCTNIAQHLADSSVALVFTQTANSATNIVGSAVRDANTVYAVDTLGNFGILDLTTGQVVATDKAIVLSPAKFDARIETYGFVKRGEETPEGFTQVTTGDGLTGVGTAGDPLAVDFATGAEVAAGDEANKAMSPLSNRPVSIPLVTTGDRANDEIEYVDVSDSRKRKRISLRNLTRQLLSFASTSERGIVQQASTAEAVDRQNNTKYLTPATGVRQANVVSKEAANKSVSSTSYIDVDSVVITPSSTSATMEVTYSGVYRVNGQQIADFRLMRDAIQIREIDQMIQTGGSGTWRGVIHFPRLDSPGTTSAVTYKLQVRVSATSPVFDISDGFMTVKELH